MSADTQETMWDLDPVENPSAGDAPVGSKKKRKKTLVASVVGVAVAAVLVAVGVFVVAPAIEAARGPAPEVWQAAVKDNKAAQVELAGVIEKSQATKSDAEAVNVDAEVVAGFTKKVNAAQVALDDARKLTEQKMSETGSEREEHVKKLRASTRDLKTLASGVEVEAQGLGDATVKAREAAEAAAAEAAAAQAAAEAEQVAQAQHLGGEAVGNRGNGGRGGNGQVPARGGRTGHAPAPRGGNGTGGANAGGGQGAPAANKNGIPHYKGQKENGWHEYEIPKDGSDLRVCFKGKLGEDGGPVPCD